MSYKLEYLASGNTLLSIVSTDGGTETPVKGFFPNSGATMSTGNEIVLSRQNGSDSYSIYWNQVTTIIGLSGPLALPTSKTAFYKLLFTEFFVAPGGGDASSLNQEIIIANQQTMITKQNELITEQQTSNEFLIGGNRMTRRMTAPVQASVPGTMFMMRTVRAKEAVSVILKDLNVLSTTNDKSFICVYVNPMISSPELISYVDMTESTKLEEGAISAGNPTPQVITPMTGTYKYGMTVPNNDSALHSKLNIPISLQAGDVLCWTVTPNTLNLDIYMFQSLLEK